MSNHDTTLASVTLILLGDDLIPRDVTRSLGMFPDHEWRRGEFPTTHTPDGQRILHPGAADWGGWKKFVPATLRGEPLEVQIKYWTGELASKSGTIRGFSDRGWSAALDCFVTASDPEVVEIKADLLTELAGIGVDLNLHFYPSTG